MRAAALALLVAAGPQGTQVIIKDGRTPIMTGESRGEPVPVHLSELVLHPDQYNRRNVRVRGSMDRIIGTGYFRLHEATDEVLLLPIPELGQFLEPLTGRPVEITGYVRILPKTQAYNPHCGLESHCDDPDLPTLPNERPDWPTVSITVFNIKDDTPLQFRRRGGEGALSIGDVVANAASHRGQKVRAVGRFRGRNLFKDLPVSTQRQREDWILEDEGQAVWVVGKAPRGKGWALDPMDASDTVRWLLVEGRVEVRGETVYLRASKVELTSGARAASEPDPPR